MDLQMPGVNGLAAIAELAKRGVAARVLVLTTYDTDGYVVPAIEAGATGYLLKDAPRDELLRAVRAAAAGQSVLAPSVASTLMNRVRTPPPPDLLSPRELEVLRLVAAATPTGRPPLTCSSARRRSRRTCSTSTPSSRCRDRASAVAEGFRRGLL